MFDMSKIDDVNNVSMNLHRIALAFYKAIHDECWVELRIIDLPAIKLDSIQKIKLSKVLIDEERKNLILEANSLMFMFQYDQCNQGTSSFEHEKFYFESKNISLTVTVFWRDLEKQ